MFLCIVQALVFWIKENENGAQLFSPGWKNLARAAA